MNHTKEQQALIECCDFLTSEAYAELDDWGLLTDEELESIDAAIKELMEKIQRIRIRTDLLN